LSSKWSGLACPDCGCMKMAACDSRRIAGGMLRIRQCQNPKCLRRVHTIEKLRSNRTWKAGAARAKKAGSPNRPG
jgi:transcriptional regulator NrdR family protein